MKTEDICTMLDRTNRDYTLSYALKGDMVHFTVDGISDEFRSSVLGDECVVSTSDWHEHFSTIRELDAFLRGLFSGRIEIIVTFRGDKPVSHRVQIIEDSGPRVFSRTGALFVPFWKPRTQRKLDYKIPAHKPDGGPTTAN